MKSTYKSVMVALCCLLQLGGVMRPAWSGLYELTASLDVGEITADGEAVVTVVVRAPDGINIPVPKKPIVDGLELELDRDNVEFNSLVKAGNIITVKSFPFIIRADRLGEYDIPPFVIEAAGVSYKSGALKLIVRTSSASGLNQTIPPSGQVLPAPLEKPFWVSATLNKTEAFQNEQLIYTLKLMTRESLEMENIVLPDWQDFWTVELVPEKRGNQIISGVQFLTYEKVFALFPLKAGKLVVEPSEMHVKYTAYSNSKSGSGNVGSFSYSWNNNRPVIKKETLKSESLQVQVAELPTPIPPDFTGLVGQFNWKATLSEENVEKGDSVTLDIILSGRGNVRNAILPKFVIPGLKAYEDKPIVEELKTVHGISGEKKFKIAFVAEKAGTYDLSHVTASYFDPFDKSYKVLASDTIKLVVNGVPASSSLPDTPQTPSTSDKSGLAHPFIQDPDLVLRDTRSVIPVTVALIIFLPPLFMVFFGAKRVFKMVSMRSSHQLEMRRSYLHLLRKLRTTHSTDQDVLLALRDYFGQWTRRDSQSLTAYEMGAWLSSQEVEEVSLSAFIKEVQGLEAFGFSGKTAPNHRCQRDELLRAITTIHKQLTRKVK